MTRLNHPIRVLFVVSSSFWITAVEAREIMKYNPRITGVLCSVPLLEELLRRAPYLKERVDIVHFLVPVAGRRYLDRFLGKIPCVSTIHHIEPGYVPEAIPINLKADAIMVVAKMWREELIRRGASADRVVVVPNGVDTSVFRPPSQIERMQQRHVMDFEPDETVIGFSGKPGRDQGWRKGVDVLFQALEILVREGKRIGIVVGGPGWGEALARLRTMGIKTYWRQYVHRLEDVAPMYRAMDFYWVTSRIEGGPVPLLEAMSSGVCCISTKVGIAPEVIKDGINGHLVDIEDAPRIAQVTLNLMGKVEERERIAQEARKTILSGYDWSRTTKRVLMLYETAMANFERRFVSSHPQDSHALSKRSRKLSADVSDGDGADGILKPKDVRWLEAHERLIWAYELCRMGERQAAVRLARRACIMYPFSSHTWNFLTNLVLPPQVGERIRRWRAAVKCR